MIDSSTHGPSNAAYNVPGLPARTDSSPNPSDSNTGSAQSSSPPTADANAVASTTTLGILIVRPNLRHSPLPPLAASEQPPPQRTPISSAAVAPIVRVTTS
jgi:hypothetical protein